MLFSILLIRTIITNTFKNIDIIFITSLQICTAIMT